MARINLLPWREELRAQKKQDFLNALGAAVFCTMLVFGGVHLYINGLQKYQEQRNKILQDEIALLDVKITEISSIEEKKSKLLSKIELIQKLQGSRPEIVHLFDELPKATPDGVFLTKFIQTGGELTFEGKSQSNARVSTFMKAIETSSWLQTPKLDVIQSPDKAKSEQLSDFTMHVKQGNKKAQAATARDGGSVAIGKEPMRPQGGH